MTPSLACLALAVYFEARGEPVIGQYAVAQVVVNRAEDPAFPDSICAVIHQGGEAKIGGCQFSFFCDGKSDRPYNKKAWDDAQAVAESVLLKGARLSELDGALWYRAVWINPPAWTAGLERKAVIGAHVFYGRKKPPD